MPKPMTTMTTVRHALGEKTDRQGQAGKRVVKYLDTGGEAWGVGATSSVSVPIRRMLEWTRRKGTVAVAGRAKSSRSSVLV